MIRLVLAGVVALGMSFPACNGSVGTEPDAPGDPTEDLAPDDMVDRDGDADDDADARDAAVEEARDGIGEEILDPAEEDPIEEETVACPVAAALGAIRGSTDWSVSIEAIPLDTLLLDGTGSISPSGAIVEWNWTVASRPTGSSAVLVDFGDGRAEFFLDLAGSYLFELDVVDSLGAGSGDPGCGGSASVTAAVVPDDDVHVQLVWDNPADPSPEPPGADLDLHLVKMPGNWFSVYDCHFLNRTPFWDPETPSLDIDDVDGWGPENINVSDPADCTWYAVGVHYFSDHGFGAAYATVRIYISGILAGEFPNRLLETSGEDTGDFWDAARIHWPSGSVIAADQLITGAVPRDQPAAVTDGMIDSGLCGVP